MQAEPQKEHQWLQKLVGRWTYEAEADMGPDQPAFKATATETVRSLGGLWIIAEGEGEWIIAEGEGECPSAETAHTLMTIGYDPHKNRYVGTWIGSMMTHLWLYDGSLDETEKILTLTAEGPSMTGDGKMAKYKDVIEIIDDDHRVLTSHSLGDDGTWRQFMTARYERQK